MIWAIEEKGYSQRRACGLIGMEPKTYRYASAQEEKLTVRRRGGRKQALGTRAPRPCRKDRTSAGRSTSSPRVGGRPTLPGAGGRG